MIHEFKVDELAVQVFNDRAYMGLSAADIVADKIKNLLILKNEVNIIFAAAPSQNEFLEALKKKNDIDWSRINAFHMDEYVALEENAPQAFGNFLKDKIFDHLPFKSISYLNGNADNLEIECERYSQLLRKYPTDIVCMGIGENGHLAFNDPPVADFNDPKSVKIVTLDLLCRQQQVNDGCFSDLIFVPQKALTLTIPALLSAPYIYCIVPRLSKAIAVENTLYKEIIEEYPSTILRRKKDAILFLDQESSISLDLKSI